jgi:hypothetical protein
MSKCCHFSGIPFPLKLDELIVDVKLGLSPRWKTGNYNPGLQYFFFSRRDNQKTGFEVQNYWVLGFCPSSGILETRKHNVSETGSVSVLR